MAEASKRSSVTFVSAAAQDAGIGAKLGLAKDTQAVANTRGIGKTDLILNDATPEMDVDPENLRGAGRR